MILKLIGQNLVSKFKIYFKNFSNYVLGIVSTILIQLIQLALIVFIFSSFKTETIAGWSRQEMIFLFVYASTVLNSINFLSTGFYNIYNQYIIDGSFDNLVLRPVKPIASIIIENLEVSALFNTFVSFIITNILIIVFSESLNINIFSYCFLVLNLILGSFAFMLLYSIIGSFSFLIKTKTNLIVPLLYMGSIACYPMSIFPKSIQSFFTCIIPLNYLGNIPMMIIKGELQKLNYLFLVFITILYYLISRLAWKRFMRKYSSCGV